MPLKRVERPACGFERPVSTFCLRGWPLWHWAWQVETKKRDLENQKLREQLAKASGGAAKGLAAPKTGIRIVNPIVKSTTSSTRGQESDAVRCVRTAGMTTRCSD